MASIQVIGVGVEDRTLQLLRQNIVRLNTPRPAKPTFDQVFAARGIDVKREIRNLNRRARYAQQLDRPKCFAGDPVPAHYCFDRESVGQKDLDLAKLTINAGDIYGTEAYVKAWTLLNHLKEC